ncbi:MAG: DNA repair protein RadA [Chloroflexota bacterium]|nr:DNA repair protein RadA [Chloroflexota bacterium]
MARPESRYVCQGCGAVFHRWEGQCRACSAWNTLVESLVHETSGSKLTARSTRSMSVPRSEPLAGSGSPAEPRRAIGTDELDRVLGGGLVPGSLLLLGGEPGIGKSTLVLEMAAGVARDDGSGGVLYASGEESAAQLRLRAERLGLTEGAPGQRIGLLAETEVERIVAVAEAERPSLLVIDSIQTMTADGLQGPAGSVGQVREAAARLGAYARSAGVPVILVGHVTKDGSLAGPRTLEHLVDAVLTLEGERFGPLRLLRAAKNRFGSTEEVGVLEMTADGLRPVADPARAFLGDGAGDSAGVAVAATLEGSRPLLVEVQALVAPSGYGTPRRTVSGVDANRVALLVAVLGRRCGTDLAGHDLYVSLAGGAAVTEPALDLAIALALASSLRDRPVRPATVVCGEVSLLGELRPARGLERRVREAARLGFRHAVVPWSRAGSMARITGLEVVPARTLREAMGLILMPRNGTVGEGSEASEPVLGSTGS